MIKKATMMIAKSFGAFELLMRPPSGGVSDGFSLAFTEMVDQGAKRCQGAAGSLIAIVADDYRLAAAPPGTVFRFNWPNNPRSGA